ncbi:hypothetical protein R69927_04740 [Paraburkholderia domus]|uniref:DUF2486 family protein n=1 Tax=Paraburkholderia domus TaxID=2793075 RepID=UPI0019143EA0|nr:DUF2486 family protein [Paraburkholderia domus]MBK5089093.1 DUF2486 family protein [Burkholderia sp. R-69927]CAE6724461.1 hypothetical protein R75483_01906 [Paraburkholderia domus]CAE6889605.1 hypothetical protein R69927_04740 [Paraburkholderia domus]
MPDPDDSSIPVLHEILVPGNLAQVRHAPSGAAAPATRPVSDPGAAQEPAFAPEPRHEPMLAPEAVSAPETLRAPEVPASASEPVHAAEHAHPPEPAHPKKRARAHHAADHRHAHEPVVMPSAGVFDRAEPHAPIEAGAIVPPDIAHEVLARPHPNLDADVIAERLRGRFAGFLTGEGRGIIEARCRDALQDHTSWLVNQITREVALALETELTGWVKEAVDQEIARRSGSA